MSVNIFGHAGSLMPGKVWGRNYVTPRSALAARLPSASHTRSLILTTYREVAHSWDYAYSVADPGWTGFRGIVLIINEMSNPQATIGLHFGREWRIRRPYVYRYLDSRYVDDFFRDGSLRISSFKLFAKHDDEQRNDATEGQGMVWNRTSEGAGQTMVAVMSQGHNAYVLCGSTFFDSSLANIFSTDSGFRINDTTAFADAVAHRISGFTGGIEGGCLYLAHKNVQRDVGLVNLDDLKANQSEQSIDLAKMMGFFGDLAGDDLFFMKPNRYSHQNEYRLLWFSHDEADLYAEIKCPEARQFCTRFEDFWHDTPKD